ncbi:MAG: histidinol phosphatase-like enzyme (inositol monophosphatase family) [Myxococcota bacterium]|jgi:histidinol phosphatase-like enzyme (inositol monophosphatase family)
METLEKAARAACAASDGARKEILPRFRSVSVDHKADGSPVTEADLAAERTIRKILKDAFPEFGILGEEFGSEGSEDVKWIVDPIDGTISFSRGIPLYSTLIALVEDGEPVLGLIDLPALNERIVGWKGGGCRLNDKPCQVSSATDLSRAMVSHGDPYAFEMAGERKAFEKLACDIPMLRGYTDAFGHAQVISGGVDAMIDLDINPWDAAATQLLIPEAGGVCLTRERPGNKLDLVFGSPGLVDELMDYLTK